MKFITKFRSLLPFISAIPLHPFLNIPFFLPSILLSSVFIAIIGFLWWLKEDITSLFLYGSVYCFLALYVFYGKLPYSNTFTRLFSILFLASFFIFFIMGVDIWDWLRPTLFSKFHFFAREPSFLAEILIFLVTVTILAGDVLNRLLIIFCAFLFLIVSGSGSLFLWTAMVFVITGLVYLYRLFPSVETIFILILGFSFFIFLLIANFSYLDGSWRAPSNYAVIFSYSPIKFHLDGQLSDFYEPYKDIMFDLGLGSYYPGVFSLLPFIKFIFGDIVFLFFLIVILRRISIATSNIKLFGVVIIGVSITSGIWGLFFAPKWFPFAAMPLLTAIGIKKSNSFIVRSR